jgi:predicted DNA-binding transcriptional regulator AlpA
MQKRRLLTDVEAAKKLNLKPGTLRNWRMTGRGPSYIRIGRSIRYDETKVDQFIDSNTVGL